MNLAHKTNGQTRKRRGPRSPVHRTQPRLPAAGRTHGDRAATGAIQQLLTDQRVREFIMDRCRILAVVGLHPNTFKPHTGTKTSVLFVQTWNEDPAAAGRYVPKWRTTTFFSPRSRWKASTTAARRSMRAKTTEACCGIPMVISSSPMTCSIMTVRPGDGIAEAFREFAAGEGLSFFRARPFDSARLSGLLEGLEASVFTSVTEVMC